MYNMCANIYVKCCETLPKATKSDLHKCTRFFYRKIYVTFQKLCNPK